jgi:hypothetical protein
METTMPALAVHSLNILTVEEIKAAYARGEQVAPSDPMLAHAQLPLRRMFYPLGFPLEVLTNCEEVLDIANECWRGFSQLFEMPPLRFHIGVTAGGPQECPPAPYSRVREHLCSHVADAENYAVSDASAAFTFMWLAETALAHPDYIRYFMLDSCAMFHLAARHSIGIHAGCVEWEGNGLLLCGDSGAGKSTLAYACARAGWTYITDDASFLVVDRDDSLVVGNARQVRFRPSAEELFPEIQGRPILQRAQAGKPSIELSTAPFAHIRKSFSSHVRHMVFLKREAGCQADLQPLPIEIARAYIFQRGVGVAQVAGLQTAAVDRLLARGVFELHYSNLDGAIDRLARLAREGC